MHRRSLSVLIGSTLVVTASVALSAGALGASGGGTSKVALREWAVVPAPASATAGKITFVVKNTGKTKHEFVVIKTDLAPAKLPVKKGRASEKGAKGEIGANGPKGETGAEGPKGDKGDKGDSGLTGAFYATAFYNQGNTNAGAIATVACDADPSKTDYVAIAGGVQVLGLDEGANSRNTPVSSSFPGRMDWATNAPKPNRLDGWIVQFGGNAGATSDKAPENVKVWALCVPGASIPVNQTFQQVG